MIALCRGEAIEWVAGHHNASNAFCLVLGPIDATDTHSANRDWSNPYDRFEGHFR
jgi:hypothetical protein